MSSARITQRDTFYAIQDGLTGLCFCRRADKPAWRIRPLATWFRSHAEAEACVIERQVCGPIEIVRFDT